MIETTKPTDKLSAEEKRALLADLLRKKASEARVQFPLSHGQQALWFLWKLAPESWAYNNVFGIRILSPIDVQALRRAFQTIVDRHPAFRTVYTMRGDSPVQQVQDNVAVHLEEADASDWTEAKLLERLAAEARRPFDLETGPVIRVSLFTRSASEHVLFLSVHHIAFDFWSFAVLLDEFRVLYAAEARGKPAALSMLTRHYADFVRWESQMLSGPEGEQHWAYWQQQLSGAVTELDLPADRPRPPAQAYRGSSHNFKLSPDLTERLKALAKEEGATLFTTVLAAYQVLLYRYSGQEDILVGSPTAVGRDRREFDGTMGYFVNPVVMRGRLAGDPSFKEFVAQMRQTVLDAIKHQDFPFPVLVERMQPVRDSSRSPLFQAWFVLQKLQRADELAPFLFPGQTRVTMDLGGLQVEPYTLPQQEGQFDVALEMVEASGALWGILKYNTDLFHEATAARMVAHFQALLESIVADPNQPVARLPILTGAERQQILVAWNDTRVDLPPHPACVHHLVEAQAARMPGAVAAVYEDQQLTYQALDRRANQLAHYLRGLGVGRESLVGIFMERSLEMLVALLGVHKAGAAYVPLDPAFPKDRLAYMVQDAGVQVLLTQQRLMSDLPAPVATAVRLDADWEAIARQPDHKPEDAVGGDNLAYTIYTSGSTGRPKGVQVLHQAVVNFLTAMRRQPGLAAHDVLLAVTTLSFDIAALELFLPLTVGARVVLVSREITIDGMELAARMARHHVTVMQATPATWRLLIDAGWQGSPRLKILCGGEALPRELANQLLDRCAELWNMYGPTETTIWSAVHKIDSREGPILLGKPIDNTQFYVLDRALNPVPPGVVGDLHIGGLGLARGYLGRPELTTERFVPDPFNPDPDARMYKTGDLARYWPDGNVEYAGRSDFQVKVRGFRIELGEIEAVLERHPHVRQAVVTAVADGNGSGPAVLQRLAAYIIADQALGNGTVATASDLRQFVKDSLPDYMVPSAFVFLDSFPLTPNGKVDRRALPKPDSSHLQLGHRYLAPRDALEYQLATTWENVLGIRPIGVQDNFFELGAHSLLAVRLFAEIGKIQGRTLPLSLLFQAPTVEQLANLLRQDGWAPTWSSLVPIQPGGSRRPFFCVHGLGGEVFLFRDLARLLGTEQPFYGLQAWGLDGRREPHRQIEDMAAHYVQEIRALQPEGPYRIGSLCYGLIGLEMAKQLRAQGQEVELLVLFDPFLPPTFYHRPLPQLGKRIEFRLRHAPLTLVRYFWDRIVRRQSRKLFRKACALAGLPAPRLHLDDAHIEAVARYVAQPYQGRVVFIWSAEYAFAHLPVYPEKWAELVSGQIEHHVVPGTHQGMLLEPNARILAERVMACLDPAPRPGPA